MTTDPPRSDRFGWTKEEMHQMLRPTGPGPKYLNIKIRLVGTDGNAFAVLGKVSGALRKAGVSKAERDLFMADATSGDYNHLLGICMQWVHVT